MDEPTFALGAAISRPRSFMLRLYGHVTPQTATIFAVRAASHLLVDTSFTPTICIALVYQNVITPSIQQQPHHYGASSALDSTVANPLADDQAIEEFSAEHGSAGESYCPRTRPACQPDRRLVSPISSAKHAASAVFTAADYRHCSRPGRKFLPATATPSMAAPVSTSTSHTHVLVAAV